MQDMFYFNQEEKAFSKEQPKVVIEAEDEAVEEEPLFFKLASKKEKKAISNYKKAVEVIELAKI